MNKFYPNSEIEPETHVNRKDISNKGKKHVFSDCTKRISLTGDLKERRRSRGTHIGRDDDGR